MKKIKLGKTIITQNSLPYVIAEIGVNHECSLKNAKKLILEAKRAGANAAKFQTYKANLIASKNAKGYWDTNKEKTKNQYELFRKYDLFGEKDYYKLYKYCRKLNIEFLTTPFDHDAVDMINKMVNFYKISSSDITNFPLIEKIASKKKPVILSTGASTLKEIRKALNFLKSKNCNQVILMHCILNYPTQDSDANLNMILSLIKHFPKNIIGYSDHTIPCKEMKNVCTSYILGARVIEKHFTLNKKKKGNDHYHSMDSKDLKNLISRLQKLKKIIGNKNKTFLTSEKNSRKFARRSIVLKNIVQKGQVIKMKDLVCKRPGTGIEPEKIYKIVGKKATRVLNEDHIITSKDIH